MTSPAADTRGYKLDPPRSVDDYVVLGNDLSYVGIVDCAGEPSDADCVQGETEVKGTGITPRDADRIVRNASGTGAEYAVGGWRSNGTTGGKQLTFRGLWGEIHAPEKAVARFLRSAGKGEQIPFHGIKWVGQEKEFDLDGYDGAVMTCRNAVYGNGENETPRAFCVWADHSTVAATEHSRISLPELAELTADLYRTSRVRK
ncbi:hypothetical protein [Streptomyces sp. NBC_00829]|uniref:hypothetical protein n=1 Tax=Streptomyces sp. NBC_00829 TaxID=2903679 RepID=UPI003865A215|nr:hypothetical protein OG293_16230 [Streptomyces sp. NBC_00829]